MTEIRPVRRDEVAAWLACTRVAFHGAPPSDEDAERLAEGFAGRADLARVVGAFDGGRMVATYRSFATELTVPGGAFVPACAVSAVTTLPTHRRRGLLTEAIRADLAAARGRGETVAILVASEWPIYGRYGFGPATDAVGFELHPRETRFRRPASGEAALAEPEEIVAAAPPIYEAHRRANAGAITRDEWWWRMRVGLEQGWDSGPPSMRCALVGETGLACWHVDGDWQARRPRGALEVHELMGVDADAEARLWQLVCGVDLVDVVRAERRAVDEALRWQVADGRGVSQRWRADWLWARILDVPAALSARSYLHGGRVVFEVTDELGHAAGRYALAAGVCEPTGAAADLTLPVASLSAAYLGGPPLRMLPAEEHTPGALVELDRVLRWDVAPYCATMF